MSRSRYFAKRLFGRFGLEIRRIPKPGSDERPNWLTDPVTAEYFPSYRGTIIVTAQIADARGLHVAGFPFTDVHPFVRAAKAGFSATDPAAVQDAIRDALRTYYAESQPVDAINVLQLDPEEAPGLVGQPPHACLLPWSSRSIAETIKGREIAMKEAGLQYGLSLSIADGLTAFGPATAAKLDLETKRISDLVQSVQIHGFRNFDSKHPMKALALRDGTKSRWQIDEGHHRIPIAAAMGITDVSVMVTQIVRRADVALWPQVSSGIFSAGGALKVFDRIFNGK